MELALTPIPRPTARCRPRAPALAVKPADPPESSDLDERPAQHTLTESFDSPLAPFEPNLAALCLGVAAGDHESITTLYRSHFPFVYATARRISRRDESFGLDAAQEVFLRVLSSSAALRRVRTREDLDRWLVRLTHSACIDLLRKEQRRRRRERSRPGARDGAPDDRLASLRAALAALDQEDRLLLRLRAEGHTLATLARTLGSTPGSLHGRARRAMQRVARSIRESNHE